MTPLHRHQIAWLSGAGWQRLLGGSWDETARDCLRHWAGQSLPLVVTRQSQHDGETIALGLCAPGRWQRRRLALRVPLVEVLYFDEFARLDQVLGQLPASARVAARQLAERLQADGVTARAYGSHGWEHFTGLGHLREGSDLDLWMAVDDVQQADAVAAALGSFEAPTLRLDGELVFDGNAAVAWREWQAWRAGRARTLLVKRLHGAAMATALHEFEGTGVIA
ncbi:MAG: malonate decarboxylase holo-[acyl-carrier-protein] synthase [Roseateles sp.]|uniref:malonate decarboxylase holo-[acyl-carrier-protein] synthase n=1 Tax=Roseateles sp. TaxID=1971397 RepID=UPI004034FE8D